MLWLETGATANCTALTVEVEKLLRHSQVLNRKAGWVEKLPSRLLIPPVMALGFWLYYKART